MNTVLAFVKRDFLIATNYRTAFVSQFFWALLSLSSYYFLSRFIGPAAIPGLQAYGGDYLAFVLVGVAVHQYLAVSIDSLAHHVREAQLTGTLEALLSTPTPLRTVLVSSAVYPFLCTSAGVTLSLGLAVTLFGARLHGGHWIAALAVLALAVVTFSGLGFLAASVVIVIQRGGIISTLIDALAWLLGGVVYPVSVLPDWLKMVSALQPITPAIDGIRTALLREASVGEVWRAAAPLLLFAVVLLPLGLGAFELATRWARVNGTLAHY